MAFVLSTCLHWATLSSKRKKRKRERWKRLVGERLCVVVWAVANLHSVYHLTMDDVISSHATENLPSPISVPHDRHRRCHIPISNEIYVPAHYSAVLYRSQSNQTSNTLFKSLQARSRLVLNGLITAHVMKGSARDGELEFTFLPPSSWRHSSYSSIIIPCSAPLQPHLAVIKKSV